MGDSRVFFVEEVNVAVRNGLGSSQMMWMVIPTDYLHVHPLRMQPRDGTEANDYFFFAPQAGRPQTGHIEPKRD